MNSHDIPTERRQHPRFQVKELSFVIFAHQQTKLGELIDIGPHGLAFRYLVETEENIHNTRFIDLMVGAEDFYLDQLPVMLVANREGEIRPYATTVTRIAALRFGDLSPVQKFRLEFFLDHHAAPVNS